MSLGTRRFRVFGAAGRRLKVQLARLGVASASVCRNETKGKQIKKGDAGSAE